MAEQTTEPTPIDLSEFTDAQLAGMLSLGGRARWVAVTELARRHPLNVPVSQPTPAELAAQGQRNLGGSTPETVNGS